MLRCQPLESLHVAAFGQDRMLGQFLQNVMCVKVQLQVTPT